MPFVAVCPVCKTRVFLPDSTPPGTTVFCASCKWPFVALRPEERAESLLAEIAGRLATVTTAIWVLAGITGVGLLISLIAAFGRR